LARWVQKAPLRALGLAFLAGAIFGRRRRW
jgi:hypothetical protein